MQLNKTEKANPSKGGGAKLWVYRHSCDHDCQAAEEKLRELASLAPQARFI